MGLVVVIDSECWLRVDRKLYEIRNTRRGSGDGWVRIYCAPKNKSHELLYSFFYNSKRI